MAAKESPNQLEEAPPANPTGSTYDTLKSYITGFGKKSFEAANAVASPSSSGQITLPQLIESTQTGYVKKSSMPVLCCTVGSHLIEKNTAYDYILMANAAAKDGITLQIRSGFRSMEEQTRLYNERKNPAVAKEKGVAAEPGTSNHQSGIALDLDVKMHKSDYIAGRRSAEYLWLEKYGSEFGFDHAEGAKVNEPWHWTHLPKTIVGVNAFHSATGLAVLTADTATNAAASNQTGTQKLLNRTGHDATMSLARSSLFLESGRQDFFAERSIFNANASNGVSALVGQLEAAKLTLEEEPKGFNKESLLPHSYDFTTGLWGDNKLV